MIYKATPRSRAIAICLCTPARVEARDDVRETAVVADRVEVRQPAVGEGEEHVVRLDGGFAERQRSFVIAQRRRAHRQVEGWDVGLRRAGTQSTEDPPGIVDASCADIGGNESTNDPAVTGLCPQRLERGDGLVVLLVPIERQPELPLCEI